MKNKIVSFFSLIIVLVIISCNNNLNNKEEIAKEIKEINVQDSKELSEKSFKELLKSFSIVRLESNDKCFLTNIDKIVNYDNKFFILDHKQSKLLVFTESGDFLYQIGNRGIGPKSYRHITSFEISKSKNVIYIHSNKDMTLYKFSLKGDFISSKKLSFLANQMVVIKSGLLAFYANNYNPDGYNLIFANEQGTVIHQADPLPKNLPEQGFSFIGGLSKAYQNAMYSKVGSSTLFEINDTIITPAYNIQIDQNQSTISNGKDYQDYYNKIMRFEVSFFHNSIAQNNSALIINYQIKQRLRKLIYLKNQELVYTHNNLKKDMMYEFFKKMSVPVGYSTSGRFISVINVDDMIDIKKKTKSYQETVTARGKKLIHTIEKANEESNPILIKYEFIKE